MNSVANTTVVGRVGSLSEPRALPSGETIVDVNVAVNGFRREGEQGEPDWYEVVLKGRHAEAAVEHLGKGDLISASGRQSFRRWKDRDGQARVAVKIDAAGGFDIIARKAKNGD